MLSASNYIATSKLIQSYCKSKLASQNRLDECHTKHCLGDFTCGRQLDLSSRYISSQCLRVQCLGGQFTCGNSQLMEVLVRLFYIVFLLTLLKLAGGTASLNFALISSFRGVKLALAQRLCGIAATTGCLKVSSQGQPKPLVKAVMHLFSKFPHQENRSSRTEAVCLPITL